MDDPASDDTVQVPRCPCGEPAAVYVENAGFLCAAHYAEALAQLAQEQPDGVVLGEGD